MDFCYDVGLGIYMFPKIICSRQAYICKNLNEGFAITCLPGKRTFYFLYTNL